MSVASILKAIKATKNIPSYSKGVSYWHDTLDQRAGLSGKAQGSVYPGISSDDLEALVKGAKWVEYSHKDILPVAQGFRANIPGQMGIVSISEIPTGTELRLDDQKGTGKLSLVAVGVERKSVDFSVLLLGPNGDDIVVWTFFPGEPIQPSELKASEVYRHGDVISFEEARKLGFSFVKVGE